MDIHTLWGQIESAYCTETQRFRLKMAVAMHGGGCDRFVPLLIQSISCWSSWSKIRARGKSLSLPFPLDPGHTTNKTKSEEPSETESHSIGNEFAKVEVVDRADAKRCMEEGNAMSALCFSPPPIQAF